MAGHENELSENLFIQQYPFTWTLENNLHVWKFPVINTKLSFLTISENELASRFRFEDDKYRFAIARHSLRLILSKYLSLSPLEIHIAAEKGQKPRVLNSLSGIQFNISHSGEWILVAVANSETGIDIEKIDPAFSYQELLPDHFSEKEINYISEAADPLVAFYYLWTRKESLIKARGTGLRDHLKEMDVLDPDALFALQAESWKLESFNISAMYPAAVACHSSVEKIIYYNGEDLLRQHFISTP
jgi:4'-phosphopantetheinyl transferase